MEKRKVYKISIIDKEISRTEFDRNTFYTSDSELTLVFKLIERDYSYDHGEILLYNEDDKSFITRKITKQENDFVYELDSDIIPHYGTWKAQLQLVNDGDVYTSKPFDFVIENDLSNLAPQPTLTDINNWSTLKKNAAELIDEMLTVIDDIKKAESKHENAEMIRQNQENSRVQSESERQSQERLRSQGESQRQTQENKRVQSENDRRLKELEREKAETQRATAESSRASAEGQRKIDHANRSAELDGKANKQQEDWITPTLLNGWTVVSGSSAEYMKDDMGFVHIRGEFQGIQSLTTIFSLPTGYRPLRRLVWSVPVGVIGTTHTSFIVQPNGTVTAGGTLALVGEIIFKAL